MGFPENLARMQNERGITNYKIAKELGISQTTIANWKDGTTEPRTLYINALAKFFGCKVEELFEEEA